MSGDVANDDANVMILSAASVLGVKGPLRFRPHGSTQKPHVILRRVVTPDDSNGDSQPTHIVRFSLFAHKRIEVKPGKEILLSVASVNGQFENQPIVFEADARDSSDAEGTTKKPKTEAPPTPVLKPAMPPRMRKGWIKRKEDENQDIGASLYICTLFFNCDIFKIPILDSLQSIHQLAFR